jgi:hypothetical protein
MSKALDFIRRFILPLTVERSKREIDEDTHQYLSELTGKGTNKEDLAKRKEEQVDRAYNFTIFILSFVVVLEAVDHVYFLKLPGSPIKRMSYAFYFLCHTIVIKFLLKKYKHLERYAALFISISCIVNLTERGIYLSPDEFKLSHM